MPQSFLPVNISPRLSLEMSITSQFALPTSDSTCKRVSSSSGFPLHQWLNALL
ncbi:MAG: hypothetical protein EORIYHIE_000482 [Candidatus Fervidibacter sp.]